MDFIDLFAGIGGFRLGLESVGFQCVFSSEIDKYARQTYKANFKEEPYGDITKIASENIPAHDILCAGFPCQPFSIAGKRLGVKDSRGNLFDEIVRIAKYHKPRILFLENVPGLLSQDKGKTFEGMVQKLRDIGYCINYKTLNAKDFGVPQNRKRVYIIATLKKSKFDFPEPLGISTKVKDILEELVDDKYFISDKAWKGHQDRKKKHLEKGNGFGFSLFNNDSRFTSTISARYYKDGSEILIEQERSNRPLQVGFLGKGGQGQRIYSVNGTSTCLSSGGGGQGGKTGLYKVNNNVRRLTPREAARLQGFPDSFVIPVSDTQAYKQFGNAVCVNVVSEIAKKIKGFCDGDKTR